VLTFLPCPPLSPGELAKHAVSEGIKAVTGCFVPPSSRVRSHSARAGLQFPVGRIRRYLKDGLFAKRIGAGSAVYLAAVLEYLAAECLELGGNAARDNRKSRITPRHVQVRKR
jgi:hypothetical protein